MNIELMIKEIELELLSFKGKQGLYVIRPKTQSVLKEICKKLGYEYKSEVAYVGKAAKTNTSDLFTRGKQEMGWSNFEGATFVRKIGLFLDFDIKDKRNKLLKDKTKQFICSNFTIECIEFSLDSNLLEKETEYINKIKPCLNDKKNSLKVS
jgi:hypothetical protein